MEVFVLLAAFAVLAYWVRSVEKRIDRLCQHVLALAEAAASMQTLIEGNRDGLRFIVTTTTKGFEAIDIALHEVTGK